MVRGPLVWGLGARWFGIPKRSPYDEINGLEFLVVSLESQTTGPQTNNQPLVEGCAGPRCFDETSKERGGIIPKLVRLWPVAKL